MITVAQLDGYKPGDSLPGGIIKTIVGRNEWLMVCTTQVSSNCENDIGVYWVSVGDFTPEQRKCIATFNDKYDAIKKLLPGNLPLIESLALAVYQGLSNPSNASVFDSIQSRIEAHIAEASNKTRCVYAISAMVFALAGFGGLLGVALNNSESTMIADVSASYLVLAAATGGLGALASVLYKLRQIEVSTYPGTTMAAFGGSSRVLLGMIFGGVLYIAASFGLVLSAFTGQPGGPWLLGFIGGISERFVPELLSQVK